MNTDFNITKDFLTRRFKEFNSLYFEGKLIMPSFEIKAARSYLGQCGWKTDDYGCNSYKIVMSDYYVLDEQEYCNTLLHEMIHLFIRQNRIEDTSGHHGKVFHEYAGYLNSQGWSITCTTSVMGFPVRYNRNETYSLVVFKRKDGRVCLMRYNAKSDLYYRVYFALRQSTFIDPIWFTSTDSMKYGSLTQCRNSFRGRIITDREYDEFKLLYGNEHKQAV